jgi:hypothetical protein
MLTVENKWPLGLSVLPDFEMKCKRLTYSNIFHFEAKMKRKDQLEAKRNEKIKAKRSEMKRKNLSCVFS